MQRRLSITPELVRRFADKNRWMEIYNFDGCCADEGPEGGHCTLAAGHSGREHIAHMFPHSARYEDLSSIYFAWEDFDLDLLMDEGL